MKKISKEWKENIKWIIEKYEAGWNQVKLANEFTTATNTTIRRILKKHSIPIRSNGLDQRKVKHNPFLDSADPDVQYWRGMIAADGLVYINPKCKNNRRISLSSARLEHIKSYVTFLKGDNVKVNVKTKKFENSVSTYYSVEFSNKEVTDTLISIGITPNKSLTLEITQKFTWPFVHGVFDGDGWVVQIHKKKGVAAKERRAIGICTGSIKFRDQLLNFFKDENIHCTHRIQKNKESKNELYVVSISTQSEVEKFYHQLYNYAPKYCIKEKYLRLGEVFGEIL